MRVSSAVVLSGLLLVASCSSDSTQETAVAEGSAPEALVLERDASPGADEVDATSTTNAPQTTMTIDPSDGDEPEASDDADAATDGTPTSSATTAPPVGSGAAAPGGGGGASSDLMAIYTGALGTFGVNDPLWGRPFANPTVASGIGPLTGLPSGRSGESAIVVKVDNSTRARPQAGLEQADVVIEQEVEGGVTRLAAIFQSQAPNRIGPVRSARTTDISFLNALGQPGLAYSGANEVVDTLIVRQASVRNYSAARFGGYWRDNARSAPSNLYTGISQFSTQAAAPPAWFHFAAEPVVDGQVTSSFVARFPSTSVTWTWAGDAWQRSQDGQQHTAETGAVLEATNVIVAQVPIGGSGLCDSTGASVPEQVWAGQGPVSVFVNGRRVDGTWVRPTLSDPALLVSADGLPIELQPGTTWIELVRALP